MEVKAGADSIVQSLFELDRSISSAAYFLPAFEVRRLTATVQGLRSELQSAREKWLPRIPFAFSDTNSIVIVTDPQQQVSFRMPRDQAAIEGCNT
jgi:Tubulin-specific chaperone C N-terminal domain